MKIDRIRAERFGAIVAVSEPAALVSVDRALARRLGVDGGALWDGEPRDDVLTGPTEAHVAATERCPAGCSGCYVDARPDGHEPSFDELCVRLDALADLGVFRIAFGGGEAALRDDVHELAAHARARGMVPTLTTSGLGMTRAGAERFRAFAQVNVSWDGDTTVYRAVRGWDGASTAERAIRLLRDAGVEVGVNTVLTRATFPHLDAIAERVEAMGACELQLLRFKPSGRGRLDYLAQRLTPAQIDALPAAVRRISESRAIAVRIDCAMVPFLVGDGSIRPEDLVRFGVSGCEAGRSLMTVDARGAARPCSFWETEPTSTLTDDPWSHDPTLTQFRDHAASPPMPCAQCDYRPACRGGCRIVAAHLTGTPWSPDPECPRVRRFTHRKDVS